MLTIEGDQYMTTITIKCSIMYKGRSVCTAISIRLKAPFFKFPIESVSETSNRLWLASEAAVHCLYCASAATHRPKMTGRLSLDSGDDLSPWDADAGLLIASADNSRAGHQH